MANFQLPHLWQYVATLPNQGAQSTTIKVRHQKSGLIAILKHPKRRSSRRTILRAQSEITNLKRVYEANANVPKVLESKVTNRPYVIMEFIEGPTLREHVTANGQLEHRAAIALFKSLLDTIEKAHSLDPPVLHRDIKSGNIIVRDNRLVLLDFGLSFSTEPSEGPATDVDEPMGNREYVPNEFRRGGIQRNYRSDLEMCCALLFFMLTGQFARQQNDGTGRAPHRRPGQELPLARPTLDLANVFFDRAFAPSFEGRFQAVSEIVQSLDRISESSSVDLIQVSQAVATTIANTPRVMRDKRRQYSFLLTQQIRKEIQTKIPGFQLMGTLAQAGQFLQKTGVADTDQIVLIDIQSIDRNDLTACVALYFTIKSMSTTLNAAYSDQALCIPDKPPRRPYDWFSSEELVTWSTPDLSTDKLMQFIEQAIGKCLVMMSER